MSYILDALDKSEQDRRSKKTPDLNSIHRQPPVKKETSRWPIIIIVMVVINSAGFWYFSSQSRESVGNVQPDRTITASSPGGLTQPAAQSVTNTQTTPSFEQSPLPTQSNPATQAMGQLITPTDITPTSTKVVPIRISALPMNVQRQIPNLTFSSHLYSEDASFRMVNINSRMIREGDTVAQGIRLLEITEEGVILSYLHYTFEISVLRDWSFN